MFYLYTFLLLILTCIICFSLMISLKLPKKIKVLSIITFSTLLLRYITLLILFYSSKITYLYNLKYSFFLQLSGIPIVIMMIAYIIIKNNKINFNYLYLFAVIFLFIYLGIIFKNAVVLSMFVKFRFGYYMYFINDYIKVYYGAINLIALIFSISLLYEKNDKISVILSCFAALVSVSEIVIMLIGINLMPQYLFGELLWIISLVYLLLKINKNKR